MPSNIKLFVIDAAPLINLAAARSLDYLLYAELTVIVPDAVFYEATAASGKLGAQEIIDWQRAHASMVVIEPTTVFQNELLVLESMTGTGYRISRDLGERAAMEIIQDQHVLADSDLALFLTDDAGSKRIVATPEKTILMTTSTYLTQLEDAKRIQSADYVFEQVLQAGRKPPAHDIFDQYSSDIKASVLELLRLKPDVTT